MKKTINVQFTAEELKGLILHYYKDELGDFVYDNVKVEFKALGNSNPDAKVEFDVVSITSVEEK